MYNMWFIVISSFILAVVGFALGKWGGKIYSDLLEFIGLLCGVIFGIAWLISLILAISGPIMAKQELQEYSNNKKIVENAIKSGDSYNNVAITQKIIEANSWYAKAKSYKDTYGNWSMYYEIDFDKVEIIGKGE